MISAKQNNNEKLVNNINKGLIDLRNDMNRKKIPENENPKKLADILKKSSNLIRKIKDFHVC